MSNISGVYIVPYGSEISFGVSAKPGYELSQMVVVCKEDNGITVSLDPKDGKYTIKIHSNITSNNKSELISLLSIWKGLFDSVVTNNEGDREYIHIVM